MRVDARQPLRDAPDHLEGRRSFQPAGAAAYRLVAEELLLRLETLATRLAGPLRAEG